METTSNLPCVDCITLPVCKARYIEAFDEVYNGSIRAFVHAKIELKKKCYLLGDHFEEHYGTDSDVYDEGLKVLYFFFYNKDHLNESNTLR